MLVLSAADVERLLDLDRLVDAVENAMIELSAGRAVAPPRMAANVAEQDAMLAAMPAYLPAAGALTAKLVTLFPHNTDRPTHQAVICCFDPRYGTPVAVMDGSAITAARTAAGSALATRLLARPDARRVSIIGTGVQARSHARALARRAGLEEMQIAGRDPVRAAALAEELTAAGIPAVAALSIEDAVRSADIVCATTHADQPVVRRPWLRSGTHVNSVGYNTAGPGEVDGATLEDAFVVVESRAAALGEPPAGAVEFRGARDRDVPLEERYAELGELAAGTRTGRTDDEQLTVYKSVGVAVQDSAAAALVWELARSHGVGTSVEL
jgi:ornithine cyclodeaminase/alanine dehydrogenase-like protein (mu-crystallin family)